MTFNPQLILSYPFRYAWQTDAGLSYIGWPGDQTIAAIKNNHDPETLHEALVRSDGNFALVIRTDQGLMAATDRVRSFPLFYKFSDDRFILTDRISACEHTLDFDAAAQAEFTAQYCVAGNKTLLRDWKQLQAGEWLRFDAGTGKLETRRYFSFDDNGKDLESDAGSMMPVYLETFRQLLAESGDRPLIVPLSGGYDSRVIVSCLKLLGAENVFCYTYGQRDSPERVVAEQVARALKYPWHFVEYSDALLGIFQKEDWQRYASKNHHFTSLPHEQDYFALYALKQDGKLPENGIVLPGFLGDYFAGSMFRNKPPLDDPGREQDAYIANRGCKFIVNAVRVYEHFGLEWRLPFASKRILEYWFDRSWKHRTYANVYNDLVSSVFFAPLGIDFRKTDHKYRPKRLRQALLSVVPDKWLDQYRARKEFLPVNDTNNTRCLLEILERTGRQKLKNMKIPFNEAHARYFLDGLHEKAVN